MSPNNKEKRRGSFLGRKRLSQAGREEELDGETPVVLRQQPQSPRKSSIKKTEVEKGDSCNNSFRRHSAPAAAPSPTKRVSFGAIDIREYERTLSDNPSVTSGLAIGIGWRYEKMASLQLDMYESNRPAPPRKGTELQVPRFVREDLLKEHGISRHQMAKSVRKSIKPSMIEIPRQVRWKWKEFK